MDNLKERIQLLISVKGLTNGEFAEKLGVQPSNISHVLSGRNKPSLDLVMKTLDAFREINTDWLINGKGSMTSDYNLFDAVGEDIPEAEPEIKTAAQFDKTEPEAGQEEILKLSEDKKEETDMQISEIETIRRENDNIEEEPKMEQKKNPHKKQHKSIQRIVIFYEDKTFNEYYPED